MSHIIHIYASVNDIPELEEFINMLVLDSELREFLESLSIISITGYFVDPEDGNYISTVYQITFPEHVDEDNLKELGQSEPEVYEAYIKAVEAVRQYLKNKFSYKPEDGVAVEVFV